MAEAEDEKKPEDGEQPVSETLLEQRDPDEAVLAEQAIFHYTGWVLEEIQGSIVESIDGFANWVQSQADPQGFDNPSLFAQLGRTFLHQMAGLFGGHTPIHEHLFAQLDGAVDQAAAQEAEASLFIHELARAARDAMWYLRDNLQAILSNQWDQLRDLAYEGSTEFIPVLHHLGLPTIDFDVGQITQAFVRDGEAFRLTVPAAKEEAVRDADVSPTAETDGRAEEQKQLFDDEESEKQATV